MQEMPFRRTKFQNGISNLYILLKSALKMQEMPFQRSKFQKISERHAPGPPYNCVVNMASPSLKSWLRHFPKPKPRSSPGGYVPTTPPSDLTPSNDQKINQRERENNTWIYGIFFI